MNKTAIIRNENGSVMVISIVILALLTFVGIAVTTTSSVELQIAGNDKVYKEGLYNAEGASMMLVQILENISLQTDPTDVDNLKAGQYTIESELKTLPRKTELPDQDDIKNEENWSQYAHEAQDIPNTEFMPVLRGFAPGSSLSPVSASRLYDYTVYGRYKNANNQNSVIIELGYKKRF